MIIALLGKKGSGKDTAGAVLAKELNGTCLAFADPMKRFCMKALGLTERQLWGSLKDKEKPISKMQLQRAWPRQPPTLESIHIGVPGSAALCWMHALDLAAVTPIGLPLRTTSENPRFSADCAMADWWNALSKRKSLTPRLILQTFGTEVGRQQFGDDIWIRQGLAAARKILDGWAYDRAQGLAKRHGGSDAAVITDCRFRNEVLAVKRAGGKIVRIRRLTKGGDTHASESEQESIPDWWCDAVIYNTRSKVEFEAEVKLVAQHLKANSWVYGERP